MPGASTSSGTSNTQEQGTTAPWSVQAPYLTQAFGNASTALGKAQSSAVQPMQDSAFYNNAAANNYAQQQYYGSNNNPNTNIMPSYSQEVGQRLTGDTTGNAVEVGLNNLLNYHSGGSIQDNINSGMQYAGRAPIQQMTQAAMQPAIDIANEQINPGIDRDSAGSGNISSSRNAIEHGVVTRGLTNDATNIAGTLAGNAYNTGAGMQQQMSTADNVNRLNALMGSVSGGVNATNAGVNAVNSSINQSQGIFNVANGGGTGSLAVAQAPMTNDQQMFNTNTNDPFQANQNFYNLVGANNWGNQTTKNSSTQTSSTPSAMSTAGSVMSMAGGMKSDARMKTDIQNVGTLNDGQNVYRYRYVGARMWHIGLLAQEVEKLCPEAVTEIHGVKHVNYDLATRAAI
jgi:hypothetical protein